MKQQAINVFISILLFSCQPSDKTIISEVNHLIVEENLMYHSRIKLMQKMPEINNRPSEHKKGSRTALLTQYAYANVFREVSFDNYTTKAQLINDSLYITINNNNGYFGNGILIKVSGQAYHVYNFDPNTLNNETKFKYYKPIASELVLNKNNYTKNDSLFGYIDYTCGVNQDVLKKKMKGYFRARVE